jgi:hypothetical protein
LRPLGVVDSDAWFFDFHACMFSGPKDNGPCFCSLCLLLNSHACWSWRKQKFVSEVHCFRGLAEKHVIMVVEFMEGVVGRMVDEAENMAATDGMLDEMRAHEAVEETGADRVVDKQRQAKTGKTKTNKGNETRKKSTEPKTNKNQEITQARAQFPHTRSKTIHYQYRRPTPFLQFPEYHRVLSEMVTKRWGSRGGRKEVRARLHREWCAEASDRW